MAVMVGPSHVSRSVVHAIPELPTAVIEVNPANSTSPCCGSTRIVHHGPLFDPLPRGRVRSLHQIRVTAYHQQNAPNRALSKAD